MGFESSRSCSLPTWLTQKSAGLVNRSMLVRIQSSALFCPDGVEELHWTLRRSRPWFESRSGYLLDVPCGCVGCMIAFEAVGRGSNPRRGTQCLWSVMEARDSAKVVDQVRLLAGTLINDADVTRRDGSLQSCFEWVRFPPASST